jgi:hypothetical protein
MSEIVFLRDQLFKKKKEKERGEYGLVRALVRFGPWMQISFGLFAPAYYLL